MYRQRAEEMWENGREINGRDRKKVQCMGKQHSNSSFQPWRRGHYMWHDLENMVNQKRGCIHMFIFKQ